MRKVMIVGLMALAGWGARQELGAEKSVRLLVAIGNYAGVQPETLRAAEAHASRIFDQAGLKVVWWELPVSAEGKEFPAADRPAVPPVSFVRLLPDSMAAKLHRPANVLGFASSGDDIWVFMGPVERLAFAVYARLPVALGRILAHELGHVLLGKNSHAPGTIMTPEMGKSEMQMAAQGMLGFSKEQADRMHERLLARQRRSEQLRSAAGDVSTPMQNAPRKQGAVQVTAR